MRIWSIHPKYLDAKGLVALWRETLLAQAVLRGETRGYQHHPQLQRFQAQVDPLAAIAQYLAGVHEEAVQRGYHFDISKIGQWDKPISIPVTEGQMAYEWQHLQAKLAERSPDVLAKWKGLKLPPCHPQFTEVAGDIEAWERV